MGAGHQVRQPAGRGPQRPGHLPQVDHPGRGRQSAPAGHRLPRHPVLPPRRLQRPAGRGRARHRRHGPRRQAALFRRVEFPWVAHRRSGAPGRRRGHRPARGQPAAVQPCQPQRRGRAASGRGGLWRGRGVLQPAGARRAHGQVRPRPAAGRRHARGAPGQAAAGNGVATGIAAHRPPHPRLPRHPGHRSRAVRAGLGAQQPAGDQRHRRPAHHRAMGVLRQRARLRLHRRGRGAGGQPVAAGHPSTPGFTDPGHPVEGRVPYAAPATRAATEE